MPTTSIETVTTTASASERTGGTSFSTTVVRPETPNGAGILLLQEIFGVGEFLLDRAEALAALGYVVSCPDVFWRIERDVALAHDEAGMGRAFELVGTWGELDPALTAADLTAALQHLRSLVLGRVAAMGYCLGGRLAYEVGVAAFPDAVVSYYGSGIADRLEVASEISCPILFHFGDDDAFIPTEQAEAIREAFASRPDAEVIIHHEAGHAFENSFAEMFWNPVATEAAWTQTVAFLSRTLLPDG
jgi:carboxymethylenebutenolidase